MKAHKQICIAGIIAENRKKILKRNIHHVPTKNKNKMIIISVKIHFLPYAEYFSVNMLTNRNQHKWSCIISQVKYLELKINSLQFSLKITQFR